MCSVLLNRTHHILISDHILALKSTAYLGRYLGSVALLSHFAKCKNRKWENKKCEKISMAENA